MTDIPAEDGLYPDIPDRVYHSDRSSLSSSGARLLLPPSCPAIFKAQQDEPPNPKPQYDFGSAAHKMVLGVGAKIVRVEAENWQTKAAQAARKDAWAAGEIPLLAADVDKAQRMAGAVYEHPLAAALLKDGAPENSGFWHDEETGVRLRCRPDWATRLPNARPAIVDYKTAVSANPDQFARAAAQYGYHIQEAWYRAGLSALGIAADAAFLFIVQEKTPPYPVSVIELDIEDVARGAELARWAINIYAHCQTTGKWLGYGDHVHHISLPNWSRHQEGELLAAETQLQQQ